MTPAEQLLPDFIPEMENTRKVLSRIPDEKLTWQAHPKSRTIGWNAVHLAEMAGWPSMTLLTTELDIAPVGGVPYQMPELHSMTEVLALFDKNVADSRAALQTASEEDLRITWSLLGGGKVLMAMPRVAAIRSMVINHSIHHRAHLCVYLRLNDLPVPGLYGTSGDD